MIFPLTASGLICSRGASASGVSAAQAGAPQEIAALASANATVRAITCAVMLSKSPRDGRRLNACAAEASAAKRAMAVRELFITRLYESQIGDDALLADLARSIRSLAADDCAGRKWSRDHHYAGYTSYASLNDLPKRDPSIAALAKALGKHATTFARESGMEFPRPPRLDSLWVNLLKAGGHHSGHIH